MLMCRWGKIDCGFERFKEGIFKNLEPPELAVSFWNRNFGFCFCMTWPHVWSIHFSDYFVSESPKYEAFVSWGKWQHFSIFFFIAWWKQTLWQICVTYSPVHSVVYPFSCTHRWLQRRICWNKRDETYTTIETISILSSSHILSQFFFCLFGIKPASERTSENLERK
jgi:hypothetical protein